MKSGLTLMMLPIMSSDIHHAQTLTVIKNNKDCSQLLLDNEKKEVIPPLKAGTYLYCFIETDNCVRFEIFSENLSEEDKKKFDFVCIARTEEKAIQKYNKR